MFSRTFIRSVSSVQDPAVTLNEFIRFVKTPQTLKPFIYRKKNANRLLAMDLKDPESNLPVQPRDPVKVPRISTLNKVIYNASSYEELKNIAQEWSSITPRKTLFWSYFEAIHLHNFLLVSTFKHASYGPALNLLYQLQYLFAKAKETDAFDVNLWFNTVVMCQLHRNELLDVKGTEMAERGFKKLWSTVAVKNDSTGLAEELFKCLNRQHGSSIKFPLDTTPVSLPTFSLEDQTVKKQRNFLQDNKPLYLFSKTASAFGSTNEEIEKFISSYAALAKQVGQADVYDSFVAQYKSALESKATEAQPEKEESS